MKTIDIYTTPQCGFCKSLKAKLDEKNIFYTTHDVSINEQKLTEMRKLTGGTMSVPVTVINKNTSKQKVLTNYQETIRALDLNNTTTTIKKNEHIKTAILTCPICGHTQQGNIPTTSCVPFYICEGCKKIIKVKEEDCCVFCSYADKLCPLKKKKTLYRQYL